MEQNSEKINEPISISKKYTGIMGILMHFGFWPFFITGSVLIIIFVLIFFRGCKSTSKINQIPVKQSVSNNLISEPDKKTVKNENDNVGFKFEDFKFGSSLDEIKSQLKVKNKNAHQLFNTLIYDEQIFDSQCTVLFSFNKDNLLYEVCLSYESNIFNELANVLEAKYGHYENKTENKLIWKKDTTTMTLEDTLKENEQICIIYLDNKYKDKKANAIPTDKSQEKEKPENIISEPSNSINPYSLIATSTTDARKIFKVSDFLEPPLDDLSSEEIHSYFPTIKGKIVEMSGIYAPGKSMVPYSLFFSDGGNCGFAFSPENGKKINPKNFPDYPYLTQRFVYTVIGKVVDIITLDPSYYVHKYFIELEPYYIVNEEHIPFIPNKTAHDKKEQPITKEKDTEEDKQLKIKNILTRNAEIKKFLINATLSHFGEIQYNDDKYTDEKYFKFVSESNSFQENGFYRPKRMLLINGSGYTLYDFVSNFNSIYSDIIIDEENLKNIKALKAIIESYFEICNIKVEKYDDTAKNILKVFDRKYDASEFTNLKTDFWETAITIRTFLAKRTLKDKYKELFISKDSAKGSGFEIMFSDSAILCEKYLWPQQTYMYVAGEWILHKHAERDPCTNSERINIVHPLIKINRDKALEIVNLILDNKFSELKDFKYWDGEENNIQKIIDESERKGDALYLENFIETTTNPKSNPKPEKPPLSQDELQAKMSLDALEQQNQKPKSELKEQQILKNDDLKGIHSQQNENEYIQKQDIQEKKVETRSTPEPEKPISAEELLIKAKLKFNQNELVDALELVNGAITSKPEFIPAYDTRASIYSAMGKNDLALKDLQKIEQSKQPEDKKPEIMPPTIDEYKDAMDHGKFLFRGEQYGDAFFDFDKAVKLRPDNAEAYEWRGKTREKINQKAEAEADFEKSRQLNMKT